jgi:hypothetical protein
VDLKREYKLFNKTLRNHILPTAIQKTQIRLGEYDAKKAISFLLLLHSNLHQLSIADSLPEMMRLDKIFDFMHVINRQVRDFVANMANTLNPPEAFKQIFKSEVLTLESQKISVLYSMIQFLMFDETEIKADSKEFSQLTRLEFHIYLLRKLVQQQILSVVYSFGIEEK